MSLSGEQGSKFPERPRYAVGGVDFEGPANIGFDIGPTEDDEHAYGRQPLKRQPAAESPVPTPDVVATDDEQVIEEDSTARAPRTQERLVSSTIGDLTFQAVVATSAVPMGKTARAPQDAEVISEDREDSSGSQADEIVRESSVVAGTSDEVIAVDDVEISAGRRGIKGALMGALSATRYYLVEPVAQGELIIDGRDDEDTERTPMTSGEGKTGAGSEVIGVEDDTARQALAIQPEPLANGLVLREVPTLPSGWKTHFKSGRQQLEAYEEAVRFNSLAEQDAALMGEEVIGHPLALLPEVRRDAFDLVSSSMPSQITEGVRNHLGVVGAERAKAAYLYLHEQVPADVAADLGAENVDTFPHLFKYQTSQGYRALAGSSVKKGVEAVLDTSVDVSEATLKAMGAIGLDPLFNLRGDLYYDGLELADIIEGARTERGSVSPIGIGEDSFDIADTGFTPTGLGARILIDREYPSWVHREIGTGTDDNTRTEGALVIRDPEDEARYLVGYDPRFVQAPGTLREDVPASVSMDRGYALSEHAQELIVRVAAVKLNPNATDFAVQAIRAEGEDVGSVRQITGATGIGITERTVHDTGASNRWMMAPAAIGMSSSAPDSGEIIDVEIQTETSAPVKRAAKRTSRRI